VGDVDFEMANALFLEGAVLLRSVIEIGRHSRALWPRSNEASKAVPESSAKLILNRFH
jgi:hypothetical protein